MGHDVSRGSPRNRDQGALTKHRIRGKMPRTVPTCGKARLTHAQVGGAMKLRGAT
ncbi:Hypothetical protein A7982_01618 [Minicystis rosea]|nr:Hypothetical protein A7982_01618 [Minicystis rosea]